MLKRRLQRLEDQQRRRRPPQRDPQALRELLKLSPEEIRERHEAALAEASTQSPRDNIEGLDVAELTRRFRRELNASYQ